MISFLPSAKIILRLFDWLFRWAIKQNIVEGILPSCQKSRVFVCKHCQPMSRSIFSNKNTRMASHARFASISDQEKARLMEIRKAKSTNDTTRLWIDTLRQYLKQEELPELEQIGTEDLSNVLESFYVCLHTKKI